MTFIHQAPAYTALSLCPTICLKAEAIKSDTRSFPHVKRGRKQTGQRVENQIEAIVKVAFFLFLSPVQGLIVVDKYRIRECTFDAGAFAVLSYKTQPLL